ncbi:MAG: hypothetical protein FD150_35 [Rhodobacteraceae bacterium]|nr:MAG: hypothetical protein FD150_35 [Paracoccaceae bacterium]
MAGPLSSEEIEDVVSSVRRLVSNEQRPRTLSRDLNADRLLLTPALRVVPETSPLATLVLDAPVVEAIPELLGGDEAVGGLDLPQQVDSPAGLVAVEETSLATGRPTEIDPEPVVGESVVSSVAEPETLDVIADATEAEWEDEIWVEPEVVSLGEAALAAEEAEVLNGPEPDEAESDAEVGSWDQDEPIPFIPLRRRAEHLAAQLAAGEVGDVPKAATEDAAAEKRVEASPLPGHDAPQADATVAAATPLASELLDEDGIPLAVLDEAALQDIVRQTLRQELQGELGERITRNVRKLVRAEINRALMARDLD